MPYLTLIGGPEILAVRVDKVETTPNGGRRLLLDDQRPILLPADGTYLIDEVRSKKHPKDQEVSFEELRRRVKAARDAS